MEIILTRSAQNRHKYILGMPEEPQTELGPYEILSSASAIHNETCYEDSRGWL